MVQSLIVPCYCHCRYCLLSWDGKTIGCNYKRSEEYALRFHDWLVENRPQIDFNFSFGYSMEHPDLLEAIDFQNSIGSVSGRFLQMNGLRFRSDEDKQKMMNDIKCHGVKAVNFTLYGAKEYHDKFASRQGDYQHVMSLIDAAKQAGLDVSVGIALTGENYIQMDELVENIRKHEIDDIRLFIPHEEGRGITLEESRLLLQQYQQLSGEVKELLNRNAYRTEAEWIASTDVPPETKRSLLISLSEENITQFEQMGFEKVIKYVESLDEQYYNTIPKFTDLLKQYGDPNGQRLYSKRDIFQHYQKKYLSDNNIDIYDATDERQCGSRRFN